MSEKEETITVCSECLTAACWLSEFICENYFTAGVVQKTRAELRELDRESPDYWDKLRIAEGRHLE